jgi:hypothetical protein
MSLSKETDEAIGSEDEEVSKQIITITLETHPSLLQTTASFLDFKSFLNLSLASKAVRENLILMTPQLKINLNRPPGSIRFTRKLQTLEKFKHCFSSVNLYFKHQQGGFWISTIVQEFLEKLTSCRALRFEQSSVIFINNLNFPKRLKTLILDSTDQQLGLGSFKHLGELKCLSKLSLLCTIHANCIDDLTRFLSTHSLRKFKIGSATLSMLQPGDASKIILSIKKLQKFSLVKTDFYETGVGHIGHILPLEPEVFAAMQKLLLTNKNLFSFSIRKLERVDEKCWKALKPTIKLDRVTILKLDQNSLSWTFSDYEDFFSKFPNLKVLNLNYNYFTQYNSLKLFSSISNMPKLEQIVFGGNEIGDGGASNLIESLPSSIEQVFLFGCDIGDDGASKLFAKLCPGEKISKVWALGLNGNPISNVGAIALSNCLRTNPSLSDIGISFTKMTDMGIVDIASSLRFSTHLRYIYLFNQGFKSAALTTNYSRRELAANLPTNAIACFEISSSRHIKKQH